MSYESIMSIDFLISVKYPIKTEFDQKSPF